MIEPCSVVSKLPTVFLLLAALTGFIQAEVHRCLREFDPSNCNALEEVWAFDARGQKCIEMVYGGCGKPQEISNRFESRDECMLSCKNMVEVSSIQDKKAAEDEDYDGKDDNGDNPKTLKTAESRNSKEISGKPKVDEIRGIFSALNQKTNQLQANVPETKLPQPSNSNGRQSQLSWNTMGIDRYDYGVHPQHRSLGPISAFLSPSYAPYPVGHNIMYRPLSGNIIQAPIMQSHAPMYGQGLQWDLSPSLYHRSMYSNIPGMAITGAYPFFQSVPWLPRHTKKK